MKRNRLILILYGTLDTDGRVLRSVEALKEFYEIKIITRYSSKDASNLQGLQIVSAQKKTNRSKYTSLLRFYLLCLKEVISYRPSLIYIHDYYLASFGLLKAVLPRVKFIYDAHELIFDQKNSSIRNFLFAFLEEKSIRSFDLVIAANTPRAKLMEDKFLINDVLVVRNIPHYFYEEDYYSLSQIQEKFGVGERRFLLYQGFLAASRDLYDTFEELEVLKNQFDLIVLGAGDRLYIDKLKRRFPYIKFLGKVDLKSVYSFIRHADYGIISYSLHDFNNRYCAPNKLYEYAALSLPMISTNQALFNSVFEEYKIGITLSSLGNETDKEGLGSEYSEEEFIRFNAENNWEMESIKLVERITSL